MEEEELLSYLPPLTRDHARKLYAHYEHIMTENQDLIPFSSRRTTPNQLTFDWLLVHEDTLVDEIYHEVLSVKGLGPQRTRALLWGDRGLSLEKWIFSVRLLLVSPEALSHAESWARAQRREHVNWMRNSYEIVWQTYRREDLMFPPHHPLFTRRMTKELRDWVAGWHYG
jgi:hypothetical protein